MDIRVGELKHGEIKSMRTSSHFFRKGIARKMLEHIVKRAAIRS